MKRAIALLLALVMMFALCGCGSQSETKSGDKASASDDPVFKIEGIKYVPAADLGKGEKYSVGGILDYKITCLYPQKDNEEYPNMFNLHYVFLDEDGVSFASDYLQFSNMSFGDAAWATSFDNSHIVDKILSPETIEKIKTVKFVGYDVWGTTYKEYKFNEPIIFDMTDVETELVER